MDFPIQGIVLCPAASTMGGQLCCSFYHNMLSRLFRCGELLAEVNNSLGDTLVVPTSSFHRVVSVIFASSACSAIICACSSAVRFTARSRRACSDRDSRDRYR